jgi:hypothetical protein
MMGVRLIRIDRREVKIKRAAPLPTRRFNDCADSLTSSSGQHVAVLRRLANADRFSPAARRLQLASRNGLQLASAARPPAGCTGRTHRKEPE